MEVYNNVLELIGNTPMVRLPQLNRGLRPTLLAKLEMFNPGNNVKDRIGIRMIREPSARACSRRGGTIVEPTSGNTGTGLAIAAAILGYKLRLRHARQGRQREDRAAAAPTGPRWSPRRPPCPRDRPRATTAWPTASPARSPAPSNPTSTSTRPTRRPTTTPPARRSGGRPAGKIDAFVAGVGTGGTITGIGRYLKEQNPNI